MIIVHEGLAKESEIVADRLKKLYGLDCRLFEKDLTSAFVKIPKFNGFRTSSQSVGQFLKDFAGERILVVTDKDIYSDDESQDDDWMLGYYANRYMLALISTARMKRFDNKLSKVLKVPDELYAKRLGLLAVHEVGHGIVDAPHFKLAKWVNGKTGHELWLGNHCTDNSCVMYEAVDIRAPPKEEGYLLLGDEKRYDAGLDDILERINPNWFCERCISSICEK